MPSQEPVFKFFLYRSIDQTRCLGLRALIDIPSHPSSGVLEPETHQNWLPLNHLLPLFQALSHFPEPENCISNLHTSHRPQTMQALPGITSNSPRITFTRSPFPSSIIPLAENPSRPAINPNRNMSLALNLFQLALPFLTLTSNQLQITQPTLYGS